MKRVTYLFAFILCYAFTASAQVPERIGIKTSLVGHQFINQCEELRGIWCHFSSYSTFDYGLALVGKWKINRRINLMVEPGVSNRRWAQELDYAVVDFKFDSETGERIGKPDATSYVGKTSGADLVYITLPVEGQMSLAPDWLLSPYLEAGPRLDILVSRTVFESTPPRLSEMINHYDRVTAGVNTGLGLSVEDIKGFGDINVGVNINWDIISSYSDRLISMHNRAIEFYVRAMF